MSTKKILSLYDLKWNPFTPDIPIEGILRSPRFDHFCWRVESLALEGGFALISGDSGLGKSISMRLLHTHLSKMREITVGILSRPQSGVADFYRELGFLFGIELRPNNRWGGYKLLRERWQNHIDSTLLHPVLLIDEVQEMQQQVLCELRLLVSQQFDSQHLLAVVMAGDNRILQQLKLPEMIPLGTRIRTRLHLETYSKNDLVILLKESCSRAGNSQLLTQELIETLAEHAAGNPRIVMALAAEILSLAVKKEKTAPLDVSLYLETFPSPTKGNKPRGK